MPNRLAQEPSPYLLQHAHNPVDWYPWGDEAFARAVAGAVALQRVLVQHYLPGALTLIVEPGVHQNALATRLPWLGAMVAVDGEPTAYLCRDFACQAPVTDPDAFRAQLETVVGHTDR